MSERPTLASRRMRAFYDHFVFQSSEGHDFPTEKYRPATSIALGRVHTDDYLHRVESGQCSTS